MCGLSHVLVAIRHNNCSGPVQRAQHVTLELGVVEGGAHSARFFAYQVQGDFCLALLQVALEAALGECVDDDLQQHAGLHGGQSRAGAHQHEEDVVHERDLKQVR